MKLNKVALVLAAMGIASVAHSETIWEAGNGDAVNTGSDTGYWYGFDDAGESGGSTWSCGGTQGAEGNSISGVENPEDPGSGTVDCGVSEGPFVVDFSVTKEAGSATYGFAGIGFNLGADVGGVKDKVDLTSFSGITIDYSSDCKIKLQASYDDEGLAYRTHEANMASGAGVSKSFDWSDFRQPAWDPATDIVGDLAANLNVMEAFKFQAHSGYAGVGACKLTIDAVKLNGASPVFGGAQGINLEYNLVGENLVFNGLTEALNVEVFDLQGKMVANGEVSSSTNSISLEGLKNASYVVRTTAGQFLISIAD
jgi:hypothetical protein